MISPSELQAFIDATYAKASLPPTAKKTVLPKFYTVTFAALAAVSGQGTQQVQIGANGDFFLTRLRYRANIAAAAQTVASVPVINVRALITDSGSDEQWMNALTDINCLAEVAGSGDTDMDLPMPRYIPGRSTITVQLQSFEAAITPALDFVLCGVLVKIY